MTFPITPLDALVEEWFMEQRGLSEASRQHIATAAAQWGADQELEACCEWTQSYAECGDSLRAARRPKPPSLKEQAIASLEEIIKDVEMRMPSATAVGSRYQIMRSNALQKLNTRIADIRRALEQLND
jgi:hypothetical protein